MLVRNSIDKRVYYGALSTSIQGNGGIVIESNFISANNAKTKAICAAIALRAESNGISTSFTSISRSLVIVGKSVDVRASFLHWLRVIVGWACFYAIELVSAAHFVSVKLGASRLASNQFVGIIENLHGLRAARNFSTLGNSTAVILSRIGWVDGSNRHRQVETVNERHVVKVLITIAKESR